MLRAKPHRGRPLLSTVAIVSMTITSLAPAPLLAKPKVEGVWKQDSCKLYRKPFSDIRDRIRAATVGGALGGLAVAVAAAKLGGAKTGTALLLGAIGGIAGATIANLKAKRDAGLTGDALTSYVDSQYGSQLSVYDRLSTQVLDLGNCRRGQLFSLRQDFDAARVSKEAASQNYTLVMTWLQDDEKLVSSVMKGQQERVAAYAQSFAFAAGASEDQIMDPASTMASVAASGNAEALEDDLELTELGEPDAAPPPPPPPPPVVQRTVRAPAGARLRSAPTGKSTMLGLAPRGATLAILPDQQDAPDGWFRVQWNGKTGYVAGDALKPGASATPAVAAQVKRRPATPTTFAAGVRAPKVIRVKPATLQASATSRDRVAAAIAHDRTAQRAKAVSDQSTFAEAQALQKRMAS